MSILNRLQLAANAFRNGWNPSDPRVLARDFLRYGNQRMHPQWTTAVMTDKDMYSGYVYAAINNRAAKVADLATDHLKTDALQRIKDEAKRNQEVITHPYLEVIDNSPTFSNHDFWYEISTFLDLEGDYYLLAVRGLFGETYGDIQSFELMSPYDLTTVWNDKDDKVEGYIETRNGLQRSIPPHMIIPIRKMNPFDRRNGFAPVDAAKEAQFTLKQSGDHTRHSIQHNINAPGIINTAVTLDEKQMVNFRERITGHVKGEPIVGSGDKTAISWEPMQIDLDKAAVPTIHEVNLSTIIATTGVSKTMLGIEQSGVTRDTARVQMELFTDGHIIPQLQLIIDALNQDYKKNYAKEYVKTGYKLWIDNPLKSDKDAEAKDVEISTKRFDLYSSLVSKGYDTKAAAKYAQGEIDVADLGKPKEPEQRVAEPQKEAENKPDEDEAENTYRNEAVLNSSGLQNAIVQTDQRMIATIIDHLTTAKNAYKEDELLTETEQQDLENELAMVLGAFYLMVFSSYGGNLLNQTAKKYNLSGIFSVTTEVKRYAQRISHKAANSHIDTVLQDAMKIVNERALAGDSIDQIVDQLTTKYSKQISKQRAETIARTETNRAFTMTQYHADKQFLSQNELTGRAYKQWVTNSSDPCEYCLEMSRREPIPFAENFANIGDVINVTKDVDGQTVVKQMTVAFADLEAGNAHPNCSCAYELIVR